MEQAAEAGAGPGPAPAPARKSPAPAKPSALTGYFGIGFDGGKPPKPGKKRSKSPKKVAKQADGAAEAAAVPATGAEEGKKLQHGESTKAPGKASPQMSMPASSVPSPRPQPLAMKEKVNKDILQRIKEVFKRADADGSGRLGPEEFVTAFKGILQTEDGGDEEALGKLFMRIDANCDGTLDWDEFSNYMLLESQGAASIRELESSISFENPEAISVPSELEHKKIITYITHITLPNGADRYITCGKDGLVKVWNSKDMKHLKTINTGKSWVTCAKWLPGTRKLAVSSFARSMKIYDLQTFEQCGQIPEIDYAPMSMDVWVPARNRDVEMVVFGDGGGFVRLYELRINPMEEKNSSDRYVDTQKWKYQHHTDWVTCVKYIEEMNAIVAGSLDKTISITDAEDRVPLKVLEGHVKGVTAVSWSPLYKFVASGGQDRRIMLWNPFSLKPLATLQATSSVQSVLVNDRDNQIITLTADKTVKLWDIRNHRCIQTLSDRVAYSEEDTLLCSCYDQKKKALITGNLRPKLWRQTITASASSGHRQPVVRVLYNSHFNEAVSGDQAGTISVWHVKTGKLRFRFHNTHPGKQMTAMAFDQAKRRLLTGCESGEVKVWNFSSGQCLCTLHPRTTDEVTAIVALRIALLKQFLVGGWDRKVTYYEDAGTSMAKDAYPGRVIQGHKADILDMALMDGAPVLGTVSDDGEACVWSIESGALRRRMIPDNHKSKPMNEQAVERVIFLKGRLKHVVVTVGADRFLRLWDSVSGACLGERFTGHRMGETVTALGQSLDNTRLVTGDSYGFIKVWDISGFTGQSLGDWDGTEAVIKELALWRAHTSMVTNADWVPSPHGAFVLTSSMDKTVSMWSERGAFVGQFGAHVWLWDTPGSWRSADPFPLEPKEEFEMSVSQERPKRPRSVPTRHMRPSEGADGLPAPGLSHTSHLHPSTGVLSQTWGQLQPSVPSGTAASGAPVLPSARTLHWQVQHQQQQTQLGVSSGGTGGLAGAGASGVLHVQQYNQGTRLTSAALGRASLAASSVAVAGGAAGGGAGGGFESTGEGAAGALTGDASRGLVRNVSGRSMATTRTHRGPITSAPEEVARVIGQSQVERLKRNMTRRKAENSDSRYSRAVSRANSRPASAQVPDSLDQQLQGAGASTAEGRSTRTSGGAEIQLLQIHPGSPRSGGGEEDDEDLLSDEDELLSESESSSAHESDEDVPRALWLEEFELARRRRQLGLHTAATAAKRDARLGASAGFGMGGLGAAGFSLGAGAGGSRLGTPNHPAESHRQGGGGAIARASAAAGRAGGHGVPGHHGAHSMPLNHPSSVGRATDAVAHMLKISGTDALPERPATTYSVLAAQIVHGERQINRNVDQAAAGAAAASTGLR